MPKKYTLTEEEYERVMNMTKRKADEARDQMQEELSKMSMDAVGDDNVEVDEKYNMANYDSDDGAEEQDGEGEDEEYKEALLSKVEDLMVEEDEDENDPKVDEQDEQSDLEDLCVESTDRVIMCGRTEDDVSYLDMYVYDDVEETALYCHHDIMLPSFPLCIQPINHEINKESSGKNYVAVGSFEPDIEIWNMDVLECACPTAILKGHKDAVMALHWNTRAPNVLASASADKSVIIWNLDLIKSGEMEEGCLVKRVKLHKDKIQSVQWNMHQPHLLATASYDRTIKLLDAKTFEETVLLKGLNSDPECLRWNPHVQGELYCSDESGHITILNAQEPGKTIRTIEAHKKACTAIDFHPVVPGILLTASADRSIKVWDLHQGVCLLTRDLDIGKIFTASFAPDSPFLIAVAGSHGELKVVNLEDSDAYSALIKQRLTEN